MATYSATDLTSKNVNTPHRGNAVTYYGSVTNGTNVATADKLRMCVVPAGVVVTDVVVRNASLGTTVPATIQLEPLDGSSATSFTATDDVTLQTASKGSVFGGSSGAVRTTKDSYLTLLVGTVSAGGQGAVSVVVHGEGVGAA
jgi:hypothetical protein